ncbi:synapse differentiation-inducing gene protein 1 isoform X1 [Marmota monax]|uniref:synapse differentiation-inducing gene protein 1 isoform X1 n=1 Tax=Marmota monax TaxID=9995 RepID=UPI001EB09AA2|nr:synapse differentiation-inducing gene protein 1 isoform X1 [Marmota monax]XP_046291262.1 synapse differentiation-inducing gene protein 1 isoform X1 [Marmota monax]XP_046291266.1 synapse differentiation-inducing gene protein 1 isoform X1 [Marmota monax]XP_046291274.1 synapse differentiation-inducing gene protein 1 isoform X1 [Marmota monax]
MDGIIEQKSVLVHSKISDAGKRNGLINTRNFMAESRDGLVSVYPAPQYQSRRVVASTAPASLDSSRNEPVQQLLDPNTLQQSVESHYRPNIILYSEGVLRSWGDGVAADCCETTFIEDRSPTKDSLEYPDGKFIDLSADDIKIHTLSYDVEEEEELQELESDYSSDTESEDNFLMMPPRDHLGLSVFSMLCCFWPLGIAAFYLSHEEASRAHSLSSTSSKTCLRPTKPWPRGTSTRLAPAPGGPCSWPCCPLPSEPASTWAWPSPSSPTSPRTTTYELPAGTEGKAPGQGSVGSERVELARGRHTCVTLYNISDCQTTP